MSRRLRILAVAPQLPLPDRAAGCLRFVKILEHYAQEHHVDLYLTSSIRNREGSKESLRRLKAIGVRVIPMSRCGWFEGCLRRTRYDVGWFEFWHQAEGLQDKFRSIQPWAKLIVDSVDIHFQREGDAANLGLISMKEVESNRSREIAQYCAADAVVVVSNEDKVLLEITSEFRKISIIPIIVPSRERPKVCSDTKTILFVGGFTHMPNADGVLWFSREIWPLVRAQAPSSQFLIAGNAPTSEVQGLHGSNGISVLGYVNNTGVYLDSASVSVAPLRYGGGMKGKVSEALASSVPVVTTTAGARGFGIINDRHAIVTDSPNEFANGILRLLKDPDLSERIGKAGYELAQRTCTIASARENISQLLVDLVPSKQPTTSFRFKWNSWFWKLKTAFHDVSFRALRVVKEKVCKSYRK